MHTSKRMHFIEEVRCSTRSAPSESACIRQNVCTSLRNRRLGDCHSALTLHTSKRMHFIEDAAEFHGALYRAWACIRQNVCTSLRSSADRQGRRGPFQACIRQNVCTSLRSAYGAPTDGRTSTCIRQNVCTSLRIRPACRIRQRPLHLHTSKRMHFIEECSS